MSAIRAASRTSSMACCASTQTGCAGQDTSRAQDSPEFRQRFRWSGPSMASITSRIDAWRPLGRMAKPPECPRRDEISLARDSACNTLERKLSGLQWPRPARAVELAHRLAEPRDEPSRAQNNRPRASVASTSWLSSCVRPVAQVLSLKARKPAPGLSVQPAQKPCQQRSRSSHKLVCLASQTLVSWERRVWLEMKLETNGPKCPLGLCWLNK